MARSFCARVPKEAAARERIVFTFGPDGDEQADRGVWMSVFVEDVDDVYQQCISNGLDVTYSPHDMSWNVREMHVRHPDGHVFRVGRGIECPK
jgi:uncharacterized glyoxalase superfamily protein PhnB